MHTIVRVANPVRKNLPPAVIGGKGDDEGRVFVLVDTSERGEVSLSKREALVLAKDLVLQVIKEVVGL